MKQKLLFVCLGNICRSPAAEGIMKHIVKENGMEKYFHIESAGIGSWHTGQLPDSRMRKHGTSHGYKFDSHARQISKNDFLLFDRIIVMDNDNLRAVMSMAENSTEREKVMCMADFLTSHKSHKTIPDPYYGTDKDFELVIELLEDACNGLFDKLAKQ